MKNKVILLALLFFILISFITGGCDFSQELTAAPAAITSEDTELTVSFIDVGQGDSTLIECGDSTMLIDAGLYGTRNSVTSYIKERGIESLDYCVATHPHADHIGGMSEVIYSFDVGTLVYPICESDSDSWSYVLDACDEKGVSYLNPEPDDTFYVGEAKITVLSPERNASYDDLNDYSLVLKLEYEDVSFIFTGDAESGVEKSLVAKGYDLSADVLKCGHHGSSTSTCKTFLDAVSPGAAVISCGKDNEYGHPHSETLSALNSRSVQVYRTDLSSTVLACSDGETVTFYANNAALGSITANTQSKVEAVSYIGNKNSKVFHTADCSSVSSMKEQNMVLLSTREDAVNQGYSPCKSCNP